MLLFTEMNTKIKLLMVAIVAVVSIVSCKKEINWNAFPDPQGNGCKLTSLKADLDVLGSYDISFAYDALGRVLKATTTDGQINNFTYTAEKITAKDQDGSISEIVLENKRAVSSKREDALTVGGAVFSYTKKYTYNSDGYLIQVKNYLNGELSSTDDLSYTNGNLVKVVSTDPNQTFTTTTNYSYSTDVAVNVYDVADPLYYHVDYFSGGYYGKQSKNVLIKSSSKTVDRNGKPLNEDVSIYTYQVDAKGNTVAISLPVTTTFYPANGTATTETAQTKYSLNYNCK